jgi:CBS domain-containing protein
MTQLDEVQGLTAVDLVHRHISSTEADVTVGELRDYFAASPSRKLAVLVDGGRYVGSVTAGAISDDVGAELSATEVAQLGPTAAAQMPAAAARDLAMEQPSRRLPVVDDDGLLVGVIAINTAKNEFCGT